MQALWLENQSLTFRAAIPVPESQPGEALVQVLLAGICGTDLELLRGYYPFTGIPGHEFVGKVIKSPDPNWIGERVVGEINITCGMCQECRRGNANHCERRSVLGILARSGCFAEYLTIPLANLHRVPELIPDEAAVFTEPLAAALEILNQVQIRPDNRVLLIGAGRLGLLIAQVIAGTGCSLSVAARQPRARGLLNQLHIHCIQPDEIPLRMMDFVIEASGSADGFDLARRSVRPRGVLILKSTYADRIDVNLSSLVVDEITVVGSRCGPFPTALHMLEEKQIIPQILIDGTYSLAEGLKAYEHASGSGVLKILLAT